MDDSSDRTSVKFSMTAEEYMAKALGNSFTHYVGKNEVDRMRSASELLKRSNAAYERLLKERAKQAQRQAAVQEHQRKLARLEKIAQRQYVAGKYSFKRVLDITCAVYGVSEQVLLSPSRVPLLVRARQQIIRILRDLGGFSYPEIGRRLNRDHSTVIHSYESAINNPLPLQKEYGEIIERLENTPV